MIIKVCGINDLENFNAICQLNIDWIGINFYPPSPRYVGKLLESPSCLGKQKVGVFVNESHENILYKIDKYKLDMVQLHGDESITLCSKLSQKTKLIKVFRVDSSFNFEICNKYKMCEYFLFDTNHTSFGGSGIKFDWHGLKNKINQPYLISGGVDLLDVAEILNFCDSYFCGVDINSKFELRPGLKDINKVKTFCEMIKDTKNGH